MQIDADLTPTNNDGDDDDDNNKLLIGPIVMNGKSITLQRLLFIETAEKN